MTKPTSLRRFGLPIGLGILTLVFWEGCVRAFNVSPFLLPGPVAIYYALVDDWGLLSDALLVTLQITGLAFVCAVLGGGGFPPVRFSQAVIPGSPRDPAVRPPPLDPGSPLSLRPG